MKRLCVIGDPVGHSLSPLMHNAALEHLGLREKFSFEKIKVPRNGLPDFMTKTGMKEFTGLSVTMPHKEAIIPFIDSLSEEAGLIRAVNTVTLKGDELIGHNTDGPGCIRALGAAGVTIKGRVVVVLGAGGAAKAIAVSLALEKAKKIFILNRNPTTAEDVAGTVRKISNIDVEAASLDSIEEALADADILINATPVGMSGTSPKTIVPRESIRRNMNVFDIVYEPIETQHLKDARRVGAKTIPGTEMLLHQGALQFKLFTGEDAPIDVMRAALKNHLGCEE
jgi:shikimate dehydrogenase